MKTVDSLQFAQAFEIKGTNLYLKLAVENENALAKRLFYSLATQEIGHAQRIDEIYAPLKANKGWQPGISKRLPSVELELKDFFRSAVRADLRKNAGAMPGYELAMKMERRGYQAYEKFRNEARDETEKEFFAQMMKEESKHLESLMNVYHYLTRPGDYSQWEEGKMWAWMNT